MTLPEGTSAHLATMIQEHLSLIHKVAFMYANQADDRRDLVREIAYQICRSYKSFKGDSKPSTWIYRVAINTAMSGFRKKKIQTESLKDHDQIDDDDQDHERTQDLKWAIGQLNDADKSITLLFLEGLPYHEIGEVIGLSENAVAVKIHRIKNKLKTLIHAK